VPMVISCCLVLVLGTYFRGIVEIMMIEGYHCCYPRLRRASLRANEAGCDATWLKFYLVLAGCDDVNQANIIFPPSSGERQVQIIEPPTDF